MEQSTKKTFDLTSFLTFVIITLGNLAAQLFALSSLGSNAIPLIAVYDGILIVTIVNYVFIKNVVMTLLMVNLIPLIYFNTEFHYTMTWIIVQDIPLFLFIIIGLFKAIKDESVLTIRLTYLNKALYLFGIYFIFLAFVGYFKQRPTAQIIDELYHAFYYVFSITIAYQLKKRSYYKHIFILIIIISLIISFENIYMNLFSGANRFVTFQADILSIPIGLLFSYLLLKKSKNLFYYLIVVALLILIAGVLVTLTRSLWISVVVTIISILFLYFYKLKKMSIKKIMVYGIILTIPIIFYSQGLSQSNSNQGSNTISYRTQSIANPSSDLSFLMRVEIGYYVVKEFLKEPLFGSGLGASVQYKLLAQAGLEIFYPDNSLLFFLWKGGIIGFIIFLWLYIRFFKQIMFSLKDSTSEEGRIFMLGIWGGMLGLFATGFFAASLIKYKYDILIALVFAYIEFESQNRDLIKNAK